jgi:hypothetical protein
MSAVDWREAAVCRACPDDMHPDNNEAKIAHAKSICAVCPVALACLRDAIVTGDDQWGVRGGLKASERRAVAVRLEGRELTDSALAAAVQAVLHPAMQRTLRDIWEDHSYDLPDGHMGWRGSPANIAFQGRMYTPGQIAFQIDRGHWPVGSARRTCDVDGCVQPRHLADNVERHLAKVAAERAVSV